MIIQATAKDFAALLRSQPPRDLQLVPDSAIAPPEVLAMLGNLAAGISPSFAPAAWLIVEAGEVVGLCSIVRTPRDGDLPIGYGIAPTRQGAGAATRAVAALVAWARTDPRVRRLSAETATDNLPSQKVLARNGFASVGERVDPEDGPLIQWALDVA